jgi:aspartate aminotransferase
MTIPASDAVKRIAGTQRTHQATPATALREMGIVPLASGDPNFPTPAYICEAAASALREGYTHYASSQGDPELRAALAEQLNEEHGQNYTADEILVSNGSSGAIYAAVAGFLNPGDQALLFDPCFSLYEDVLKLVGAEPVRVPYRKDDFHLDPEALERAVTPRTKMVILNTPCNPTAVMLARSELEAIQEVVIRHELLLLSDEIYDHIVFDGRPFVSALDLPELAERTLLVNGFSKTYAMTGWRLGYLAGKNGLTEPAAAVQRTMNHSISAFSQRAGLAALRGLGGAWEREMLATYERRRRLGHELLAAVPRFRCALPEAAFYFWVKVDSSLSSAEMCSFFRENGVGVRSGSEFGPGGEGYIRLTFAASDEEIAEGIERLARAAEKLP